MSARLPPAQYPSNSPSGNGKEPFRALLEVRSLFGSLSRRSVARDRRRGPRGGVTFAPPVPAPSSLNPRTPALWAASSRTTRAWLALHGYHIHVLRYDLRARSEAARPLAWDAYGAGLVYHMAEGLVNIGCAVGLVVGAVSGATAHETTPALPCAVRHGGHAERGAYGARTLTEARLQCLPPGCTAEAIFAALHLSAAFVSPPPIACNVQPTLTLLLLLPLSPPSAESAESSETEIIDLARARVRNVRSGFNMHLELAGSVLYAGVDTMLRGRVSWTLGHHWQRTKTSKTSPDPLATRPAAAVAFIGTNRAEGEVVYLRVMHGVDGPALSGGGGYAGGEGEKVSVDAQETAARRWAHVAVNVGTYAGTYAGLLQRACPTWVYDYVADDEGRVVPGNAEGAAEGWEGTKLGINVQNCMHCKLCNIKVPTQCITWTIPEAGDGPSTHLPGSTVKICAEDLSTDWVESK
ncbi:hypothetical protein DFH09DRAFT_1316406 [Mycena vulgaris]|nr:hypothetical protein DFH09DRAFT_1316406 [Mycena vulgaris]